MSKHHIREYTVDQIKEQLNFGGFDIKKFYLPPINQVAKNLV